MGGTVRIGIFRKFGLFALVTGVLPLVITVLILSSRMHDEFIGVMETNYSQMTLSLQDRLDSTLGVYDTITTMPYYYSFNPEENYLPFDIFRRIFYGTGYDDETMEEDRRRDVESFLLNLIRSDSYILSAYFIGLDSDGSMLSFGVDSATGFHLGYDDYYLIQDWNVHDKTDRRMQIHPFRTQSTGHRIFTVSRNYFDIRGNVQDLGYVGTLYLNIDARRIANIVSSAKGGRNDGILLTHDGICWYSDNPADIGKPFAIDDDKRLFYSADSRYGVVSNIVVDPGDSYRAVETLYTLAFGLLFLSVILFSIGIMSVSKRFSKQMEGLFRGMDRVEKGDFDVPALKDNGDELGLLYDRFRNMGTALKAYIDKAYSAQLRQKEAECTALKSQIYPHFLYNTLEVIRMSAIDDGNTHTAEMIEALSEQIHYLIGPVKDFVPLSHEINIVRKYIFLLNCRVEGAIEFKAPDDTEDIIVPKLILQPLVENAYIHGLKPKGSKGCIEIDVQRKEDTAEITVMDNGVCIDKAGLERIDAIFRSSEIGIKDEYEWKSIGLKNVYDRIKLIYGDEYSLSVDSVPGVGTVFTIRIPYRGGYDGTPGDGR